MAMNWSLIGRVLGAGTAVAAWSMAGLVPAVAQQPHPWQLNLQEAHSPIMERIHDLHDILIWMCVLISLFVLGLLLLTPVRKILWVITAFTAGHSLTLAITALGLLQMPSGPVELLIALSIFFLAVEVVRKRAGKTSLTIRQPWIVAAGFGLLHGLGFAGALADIGLPKGTEI